MTFFHVRLAWTTVLIGRPFTTQYTREQMPPEIQAIMQAYVEGVNHYLDRAIAAAPELAAAARPDS
jgi:acyl-homoserine lactone acylase PvdQ